MRLLSLFLAARCRFYINADVMVQPECLMYHWRYWYTSQIQHRPGMIKSDTKAQTEQYLDNTANTGKQPLKWSAVILQSDIHQLH